MSGLLVGFAEWIVDVVYASGYVGVGLLVAAGYLHLIVPTQLVLPLAGFLVGEGRFSFWLVLAASTAGGVAGSIVLYFPGLWLGEERVRQFVEKFGRYVFVYVEDLDKASAMFERHGGKAVLIGHLIPGITALISIPAGIKRMSLYGRFMFYTILGSLLWNGIFIALGWALGANYTLVEQYAPIIEYVVLAAIALAIVWFVWRRWRAHKAHK
jgi:membrane protein DedA with SNARE-associated domain